MTHHSNRLSSLPGWEGIGRESTMDKAKMRNEAGIFNVQVILRDLFGSQLSFVGDCLRRQGVDVESTFGTEHGGSFFFGHFAYAKEFSFKVSER